jgi:hypothetical protein
MWLARVLALTLIAGVVVGCRSSRFMPADPERPNRLGTCTGTITRLAPGQEAEVRLVIHLRPRREDSRLLSAGQTELPCVVLRAHADRFQKVLDRLRVGMAVEISGYPVVERREPTVRMLRPVTSIDLYPDR